MRLDGFVSCYRADGRTQREESERFRRFTYEELTQQDKASLDIFWLSDESLDDSKTCRRPAKSPRKSWRTCGPHWNSWRKSRGIWGRIK